MGKSNKPIETTELDCQKLQAKKFVYSEIQILCENRNPNSAHILYKMTSD